MNYAGKIFDRSYKVIKCECSKIIPLTKLQKYANNDQFVNVFFRIKSVESALWLKEGGYEEPSVAPRYDIFNKTTCYLEVLKYLVIAQNNTEEVT